MSSSFRSGPNSPGMYAGEKSTRSASSQTRRSPRVAARLFQSASPLPRALPDSGRIASSWKTLAPVSRAIATVASWEWESITTSSSTKGRPSIQRSRTAARIGPIVSATLRAGRQTLTVVPAARLAATSRSGSKSAPTKVRALSHWSPVTTAKDSDRRLL